ncbi:hypothetical protein ACHAWF_007842, partial [Thalassiosira exigua]
SLLERRRRCVVVDDRPAPSAGDGGGEDEGGARGGGDGSRPRRRPGPAGRSKRRRGRRVGRAGSSSSAASRDDVRLPPRPIRPLILLALAGLASDWTASRVLNAMFDEEEVEFPEPPVAVESAATGGRGAAPRGGPRAGDRGGGRPPLRDRARSIDDRGRSDPIEIGGAEEAGPTTRFVALRRRLLSLYAEAPPRDVGDSPTWNASSVVVHPLYDPRSPQTSALNWLADVDALKLRHSDPGLVQRYVLAVMYFSTGGPTVRADTDLTKKRKDVNAAVLYISTGGPIVRADTDLTKKRKGPWREPTNWLAPVQECGWKSKIADGAGRGGGVRRCDRNGTVVEISIYNQLSGTIPTEIGRLWNLRTL